MRVALVDNLIMANERSSARLDVHPHLGLLSLAAVAEAEGHCLRIYDPKWQISSGKLPHDSTLYERVAGDLLADSPEVVGFTTLGCSFLFALNVATTLKRREPDLPILLGGPHATMLHRQILERFDQFDVVVRHEADEIFCAVLAKLERRCFEDIPGISWRESHRHGLKFNPGKPIVEDLDRLPIASYDHYPVSDLGLDLLRIEAGRGCPFACTFCSTATFFQRSFRLKSAARLVTELDRLHSCYGFSDFKLDHDMFTVNRRKVLEFCEAVTGRGYRWRASARVDCVDKELLSKMAAAGCVGLYFGIETGSERMQEVTKKRLDLALVEPTLRNAENLGIQTTASFITGYPEEREEDQVDTLDLIGRCFRPSCLPQLHVLAPEPGTAMFEEYGDTLQYDGYSGPYNAEPVAPDDERLIRAHPDVFSTYHYYPAAMPRLHHKFAAEIVDVLRRLGPIILSYTLRAYGGRLSSLVHALRLWADMNDRHGDMDTDLFEAYTRATFGSLHHLTSLIRYALMVSCPKKPSSLAAPRSQGFDPNKLYRLGSHIRVLTDMHNCDALLEKIAGDPDGPDLLDELQTEEHGSYLMNISDAAATHYRIAAGSEAVLALFEQPRSCCDVIDYLRDLSSVSSVEIDFFVELVDAGILVASSQPAVPSTQRSAALPNGIVDG